MARLLRNHLAVLLMLVGIGTVNSYTCHSKQGNCCTQCNPGFFLIKRDSCGKCLKCPSGSYMDQPSTKASCNLCKKCEGIFQLKEECSTIRNTVCECIKGKRCVGENCELCTNNICAEGQQLVKDECSDCPHGTFNPGEDGVCRSWKSCSSEGAYILFNGTSTSDVVCGHILTTPGTVSSNISSGTTISPTLIQLIRKTEDTFSGVVLIVVIVALIIICSVPAVIIFIHVVKWMKKMNSEFKKIPTQNEKTTKEEDGCSCHFPEEEQGDEDMTQHPLHSTDIAFP